MSDRKGDQTKQPPTCTVNQNNRCPNLKNTNEEFEGERYSCPVCGERFFLDYDEMK